jgi:hypothetical protein
MNSWPGWFQLEHDEEVNKNWLKVEFTVHYINYTNHVFIYINAKWSKTLSNIYDYVFICK